MKEEKYIKYLETQLEASEKEHKYDVQMIDDLKGELVKLYEQIDELKAKLEFKDWGDLDNSQFEEYMNQFILKKDLEDKINKDMKDAKEKIKYYEERYRNEEREFYKKSHHRQINRWQSRFETLREILNFIEGESNR